MGRRLLEYIPVLLIGQLPSVFSYPFNFNSGAYLTMEKQQILAVVIKNLQLNVDGLEDSEIDPEKSMADYGATSLDIVEVVNSSLRQLQIKVARTELANLKNINDLVDLLTNAKNKPTS